LRDRWIGESGVYRIIFSDGTVKSATFTNGGDSVSWTGRVSANAKAGAFLSAPGNSIEFISIDFTHPNESGVDYLSMRIANSMSDAIMNL
jgi:hypothetical protein